MMQAQSTRRGGAIPIVLASSLLAALGPGCDALFGLDPVEPDLAQPNAYVCDCTCFEGENIEVNRDFELCAPPSLNPNLPGGHVPSSTEVATDCNTRVKDTLVGILMQCASGTVRRRLEREPGACSCSPLLAPTFVEPCNGECQSTALLADCTNQQTATSVGTLPPVCMAEPGQQAMGRALFGDRSTCTVSGTLTVVRGDDDSAEESAAGVVEIVGAPCPGTGCDVEVVYRLEDQGELEFSSYAGLASVSFRDIRISGATLSSATIDGAGNGEFAASSMDSSGRGTREEEELFGTISDTETRSYVATNVDPVGIGVDWVNAQCALAGALLNATVEGADTDIVLDVGGAIVNQPPRANAGADRNVECTSPAGATVTLTAAASTDPDANIRLRDWWIGAPGGTSILDADADGVVSIAQALGGATTYALGVTDAFMSVSQDSVAVTVVDSTAPTITAISASPRTLFPLNHMMVPVTVGVTAADTCGAASCRITSVTSNQPIDGRGDGDSEVDWAITGALTVQLRAESSAPNRSRTYTISVTCSDPTGNGSVRTLAVVAPVR